MYTEEEIDKMQKSKSYWDRNDPNYKQINDDVSSWYKEHYKDKKEDDDKENQSSSKEEKSNEMMEERESSALYKKNESIQPQVPEILPKIPSKEGIKKATNSAVTTANDPISELKQQVLAAYDMTKNYFDMKRDRTKNADDYFHCKANYEATQRGESGEQFAKKWGDRKEIVDLFRNILLKNMGFYDAFMDYLHDTAVNQEGRQRAKNNVYSSAKEACASYRVKGINEKY